jgi:hypothetical protein
LVAPAYRGQAHDALFRMTDADFDPQGVLDEGWLALGDYESEIGKGRRWHESPRYIGAMALQKSAYFRAILRGYTMQGLNLG